MTQQAFGAPGFMQNSASSMHLLHIVTGAFKLAVGELAEVGQADGAMSFPQVLSLQGCWC